MIKSLVFALCISFSLSRLILPDQIHEIEIEQLHYMNPSLKTQDSPLDATSSANPVQGVANATSGYLSVDDPKTNSKLFYIFYQCRKLKPTQTAKDVPTIIWLQGGPGGSSQIGNFFEIGPYTLTIDPTTKKVKESVQELSWNDHYNLLIIDNPRGTGYSIADKDSYVTTEDQVAEDFRNALVNFYTLEPFKSHVYTPLYIFGESYAGHYIPAISKKILESNAEGKVQKIPLEGIGIGNGFVDPINQLSENALFAYGMGLMDDVQKAKVELYQLNGIAKLKNEKWLEAKTDFSSIMNTIVTSGGGVNVYNFQLFEDYDFSSIMKFFNDKDTINRYNVDPSVAGHFQDINTKVYNALSVDFMKSYASSVAYLADAGLPILVYNGQDDIICNTPAVQNWITNLNWNGASGLYNADLNVWNFGDDIVAGLQKNYKNFYFVIVNRAGHLAPMDQIETTTEMVRRFVAGETNWTKPFEASESNFGAHIIDI